MSINNLPSDVKNHIINLSGNCHAAEVCKEWRDIVQGNLLKLAKNTCPELLKFDRPFLSILKTTYEDAAYIHGKNLSHLVKKDLSLTDKFSLYTKIIQAQKNEDEKSVLSDISKSCDVSSFCVNQARTLFYLTDKVCNFTHLEKLEISGYRIKNISGHKIKKLPDNFKNLTKLTELRLYSNAFEKMPIEINELTQLKTLDLGKNKIKIIPKEIANLTQLKKLSIDSNQLKTIPIELCKLKKLKLIEISDNPISYIPVHLISNNVNSIVMLEGPFFNFNSLKRNKDAFFIYCFDLDRDIKFFKGKKINSYIPPRLFGLISEFSNDNKLAKFVNKRSDNNTYLQVIPPEMVKQLLKRMQELQVLQNNFLSASNEQEKLEILKRIQNFYQGAGEFQQQQVIEVIYFLMNTCPKSLLAQIIEEKVGLEAFLFHPLDEEMRKMLSEIDLLKDTETMPNKLKTKIRRIKNNMLKPKQT